MKNHTQSEVEKLFPGPFPKNQYWAYFWINILNIIDFVLIACQVEDYRKWLKLNCRPFAFTSYKAFLKNKKRSGTSQQEKGLEPSHTFCMIFEEKYFSFYILVTDQISLHDCLYFVRYWAISVLQLFINHVMTSYILELTLFFSWSRFFYMNNKSRQKSKYLESREQKELLRWNKKHFSSL